MIQKPLSAQLEDRQKHSMELDPDVVARSFGAVMPVNEPFPEVAAPFDDAGSEILLDDRAPRLEPKPSILELAMRRLQSLKPHTESRKEQVANAILALAVPLEALDQLISETEQEHFEAIDARREECRKRGRELVDEVIPKLDREVYKWRQESQKSGEKKAERGADAQQCFFERAKISQWASAKEVGAADKRLENAKSASAAAAELALADMRELAVAESKLESAKGTLQLLHKELHRCAAELRGDVYHDPETGLSRNPLAHREKW